MPTIRSTGRAALSRLQEFLRLESAGGLVLMASAALAMIAANSPLEHLYSMFLGTPVEVRVGTFEIAKPLLLWVNDGFMAVFFFLVGLELKREMLEGHLSSLRTASLPAVAAVGGMLVPAAIYAGLNWSDAVALRGWAIPTATDIAFALGVLALLGERVPPVIKAFLLSVAIFDDLGAIVVIALFYTAELSGLALSVGAALVLGLACLNRFGVVRPAAYLVLGVPLWIAVLKSGVHATLAGVIVAMFIPLRPNAATEAEAEQSPLLTLEHALHPWVAFGVLPLFAFANAGVPVRALSPADILQPVPLGIAAGLLLGKPLGIMSACWVAVRLGLAALPQGVRWAELFATSLLCGIGFTMSLFIASLAFAQAGVDYLGLERLGILAGSLAAGALGYVLLRYCLRDARAAS